MKTQGKLCKKCNTTEKYIRKQKTGKTYNQCVKCTLDKRKNKYKENGGYSNYNKKYYDRKKQRINDKKREKYKNNEELYIYHMLKRAEKRAEKSNIPFNLKQEDIKIPEYCPALNVKLEIKNCGKKGPGPFSPSLDKIVPELGYINTNVIVISHKANQIKNNASISEIEKILEWLKSVTNTLSI